MGQQGPKRRANSLRRWRRLARCRGRCGVRRLAATLTPPGMEVTVSNALQSTIEAAFRRQAQGDRDVKSAHLLVQSDRREVELRVAEGATDEVPATVRQPLHLASVGKLFTATVIGMLHEAGELSFDAPITTYLDDELMRGLHVYRGKDLSHEIQVRHLLNQSSGLADCFWPLLKRMGDDPTLEFTPREAVLWGKEHLRPKARPGQRHHYTDTNYHLLGLIVENVTGAPFHEALHGRIFSPLGMDSAFMQGYSRPAVTSDQPVAGLFFDGVNYAGDARFARIDYAGGGVTAELDDYLKFMHALAEHRLVARATLDRMLSDDHRSYPGMRYGYAVWKVVTVPLLMPAAYNCWGCSGVTGAFMFFHPGTGSYVIGTFGDTSYRSKALRFMFSKVLRPLVKGA